MAKAFQSVTIQGAGKAHRNQLATVAQRVLDRTVAGTKEAGTIDHAIAALLDTGLVIDAHVVKERGGKFTLRVVEAPTIREIVIEGNKKVATAAILDLLKTFVNYRLDRHTLAADIARIESIYEQRGHAKPKLMTSLRRKEKNSAVLQIRIKELEPELPSFVGEKEPTRFRKEKTGRTKRALRRPELSELQREGEEGDGPTARAKVSLGVGVDDSVRTPPFSASEDAQTGSKDKAESTNDSVLAPSITEEISNYTSTWTGRFTVSDHVRTIRAVVPRALTEIDTLIELVEARRFNDPETENALNILRSLHRDLGLLIESVETGKQAALLVRIARKNTKLRHLIGVGAKVGLVAPALTIGISQLISAITQVPIDSTMVSTVFATMVAMPLVEKQIADVTRKPT